MSSEPKVKPLRYEIADVGKRVKQSKKKHTWLFEINGEKHRLDFFDSRVSEKKKVTHNGVDILKTKQKAAVFNYSFTVKGQTLNVLHIGDRKYDLRINTKSFQHLPQFNANPKFYDPAAGASRYKESKITGWEDVRAAHEESHDTNKKMAGLRLGSSRKEEEKEDYSNARGSRATVSSRPNIDSQSHGNRRSSLDDGKPGSSDSSDGEYDGGFDHGFDQYEWADKKQSGAASGSGSRKPQTSDSGSGSVSLTTNKKKTAEAEDFFTNATSNTSTQPKWAGSQEFAFDDSSKPNQTSGRVATGAASFDLLGGSDVSGSTTNTTTTANLQKGQSGESIDLLRVNSTQFGGVGILEAETDYNSPDKNSARSQLKEAYQNSGYGQESTPQDDQGDLLGGGVGSGSSGTPQRNTEGVSNFTPQGGIDLFGESSPGAGSGGDVLLTPDTKDENTEEVSPSKSQNFGLVNLDNILDEDNAQNKKKRQEALAPKIEGSTVPMNKMGAQYETTANPNVAMMGQRNMAMGMGMGGNPQFSGNAMMMGQYYATGYAGVNPQMGGQQYGMHPQAGFGGNQFAMQGGAGNMNAGANGQFTTGMPANNQNMGMRNNNTTNSNNPFA